MKAVNQSPEPEKKALEQERFEVLHQLEDWLEVPVLLLGFVWLILLVIELVWGLSPLLEAIVYAIWAIFLLDFSVRFLLAPRKLDYLKANWLTAISLFLPALRILRIARMARLLALLRSARGLRLVKVVASLNRGMRALRRSMDRRGFSYVLLLTVIVTLVGSAGMLAFEREANPAGFGSYGEALYWTAMIMTTLGSDIWPLSAEGRLLSFFLSLYAFAVFGYVTATLATFFIGREAENPESELANTNVMKGLRAEIAGLRAELRALSAKMERNEPVERD